MHQNLDLQSIVKHKNCFNKYILIDYFIIVVAVQWIIGEKVKNIF